MKQLLQNVSTGEISVEELPAPARPPGALLVATRFSLISAGTERSVVEMGRASLVSKARARPDLARQVIDSARMEGLTATYAKVRGRLASPNALGYSLSGIVLEADDDAPARPGELVACAGVGYASHAEVVSVPRLLATRVPDGVTPEDAAYGTVACIALHGVHLAEVGLGDVVGVVGLGLVGQLTLELLRAAGCVAVGVDPDDGRVALAREAGFFATTDPAELESETLRLTERRGADGVLVTAASSSSAPLATATALARERAVVCIVGDVAIQSPRAPLFSKELRLVVSRSYGPGRYDPGYEEGGIDYPAGYVRWTEGRNLAEVLRLMAAEQVRPARLTTHTFDLAEGDKAYALLGQAESSLGILLRYPGREDAGSRTQRFPVSRRPRRRARNKRLRIGVIGAGTFARSVLMPALARGAEIAAVATATGVSGKGAATRFGVPLATTDPLQVIGAEDIDAVVIATRHDTHAELAAAALPSKHVFVEKPLALNRDELSLLMDVASESENVLMVGFNRRFAPLALRMRDAMSGRGPMVVSYRVNAGRLPRAHWTHDPDVGGGRIVGEVCHFVDFATFLCGAPPVRVQASAVGGGGSEPREDNVTAMLEMGDGSTATIVYAALGDPALPKERVEVLGEAGAAVLDDFRELRLFQGGKETAESGRREKGHTEEVAAFLEACSHGRQPWPLEEMAAVMEATFEIRDQVAPRRRA